MMKELFIIEVLRFNNNCNMGGLKFSASAAQHLRSPQTAGGSVPSPNRLLVYVSKKILKTFYFACDLWIEQRLTSYQEISGITCRGKATSEVVEYL